MATHGAGPHLTEVRHQTTEPNDTYRLVTVKRSRGGVELRETLTGREIKTPTQFYVRTGDFLISKRQIVHGACGIVPAELDGAVVSNEYAVLNSDGQIDLRFLRYLSESRYFQQTCFHSSIGVHVEKMIFKTERWLKWPFNIPPLPVQLRIVEVLDTARREVELIAAQIERLKQEKAALMADLLTGKRRVRLACRRDHAMTAAAPNSKEQYAAHLPALHLLCNLGWNFLTTAQALALRGSTREVILRSRLVEVLQTRRYEYKGQWYPLSSSGIEQMVRELSAAQPGRRAAAGQRAAVRQAGAGHHRHRVHARRQEAPAHHCRHRLGRPCGQPLGRDRGAGGAVRAGHAPPHAGRGGLRQRPAAGGDRGQAARVHATPASRWWPRASASTCATSGPTRFRSSSATRSCCWPSARPRAATAPPPRQPSSGRAGARRSSTRPTWLR